MPGRERGRSRIGRKKRFGRWCIKSWLTSPLTKWQTNAEGHESSTKTDFLSCQRLVFPCVWDPSYRDRCTSPTPCKTTSVGGEQKRTRQEESGKVVTWWLTDKASLGWKNGKFWLLPWMSTGVSTEDGWRLQVMWSGCRPQKEHICKAERAMSMPIDASG